MTTRIQRILVTAFCTLSVGGLASTQELTAEQIALFENDALPILQDNCFKCHGADKIESDLNLSSRAGILFGGARGPAIDLENPENSRILAMISYVDEAHQMPPTGKLQEWDIEALTEWVMQRAPWPGQMDVDPDELAPIIEFDLSDPDLWGFRPVTDVSPPQVDDPEWSANPIDRFIYARLARNGLEPNPTASKRDLIRRAYYDLIGLPPTPEEVEAFVADDAPDAWENLIDDLLARPQYGEKWGRHWLDLVRYADSHGYERDSNKPFIWRYRDYVIRAFNEDKPYDEFIIEQLAGDELDEPTPESITATGYYRLGLWDDEPADPLLGRYDGLDDIVDTTGRVFLGLTMGCARCHEHKLDPMPQEDYYRFLSFFENITDLKRGREGRDSLASIATADEQKELEAALAAWELEETPARRTAQEYGLNFAALAGRTNSEALEGAGPEPAYLRNLTFAMQPVDSTALTEPDGAQAVEGVLDHGFVSLWPARDLDIFAMRFNGELKTPEAGTYTLHIRGNGAFDIRIAGASVALRPDNGDHIEKVDFEGGTLPFALVYTGNNALDGLRVEISGPGIDGRAFVTFPLRTREDINRLIGLAAKNGKDILGEERYAEFIEDRTAWHKLLGERPEAPRALVVMEKGDDPPESYVRLRGNPHVAGREVEPGFPVVFAANDPPVPSPYQSESTLGRRRQVAEWIADESNPMTARVHVNRLWQYHFGRGIVRSSGNFGAVATKPTHPELLDWLAAEFMRRGWRQKDMHKLIMMSNAYRMSSQGRPEALDRDPANHLFWRFDMRRLTAEELRDSILAVSGNLNLAMFGPGIYPELAPEVVATSSKKDELYTSGMWGRSTPEEQARRSVYIHTKRSLRLSMLTDFDGADTDATCPVRFATTQPTQALGLLNSMFTHDQAAVFADRLRAETSNAREQVRRGFELTLSRPATDGEVERGLLLLDELQTHNGLSADKALDRFCLLLLNLNEFLFLD